MFDVPYDGKGTAATNKFDEVWIVENNVTNPVIVLNHRPFYGETLTVTRAGATSPLIVGKDYELVYQLPELDSALEGSVFCGIIVTNSEVSGELRFSGQELGGSYHSPFVEMLDVLVKALNNPVSIDFLKLKNRPVLYPQQPASAAWSDFVNKQYVASVIRDIDLSSGVATDDLEEKLLEIKDTVLALYEEIERFNYPAHIADPVAHQPVLAQTGAHSASLKTPDTFLAYGKTLRTLLADVRAMGMQQADIDKYIEEWVVKDVSGTFEQRDGQPLFRSEGGESEVEFTENGCVCRVNGGIVFATGYDGSDTLRYIEWKSGINTLRIESSGSGLGVDKLTLNGVVLLTTPLLREYQVEPTQEQGDPDDHKLYIVGKNGLTFTGKGSKSDPVVGELNPPIATDSQSGIVQIKTGKGTEKTGYAASPGSILPYQGTLNGYVPKTLNLNSVPMDDGARVITKTELGLGSVDNTADINKPISTLLQSELDKLSVKGHTHNWESLPIPTATSSVAGIARYTNSTDGFAGLKGVTPNVLKTLSDRLAIVAAGLASVDGRKTTDFAAIDASVWTVTGHLATVKDLNYFYLVDGSRGTGTISGTVNLEATPMFNWFSPNNRMEETWETSVEKPTPTYNWSGVGSPPRLPLGGVPIGLSGYDVGAPEGVVLLVKERIRTQTGSLNVYVCGGGTITVYVDGIKAGSGDSPFHVSFDASKRNENRCVAIRVDCVDPTQSASLRYEIYDDDVPLTASSVGGRIAKLTGFVKTPEGLRHYLYANMLSGSLFSRTEPINTTTVSPEQALVGYLDIPVGGLSASVAFDKSFDYGIEGEVVTHAANNNEHRPSATDWGFADNQTFSFMGKASFEPPVSLYGSGISDLVVDRGLVSLSRLPTPASRTIVLWPLQGQHPVGWFTPNNPHANQQPTFEGGLVINYRQRGSAASVALPSLVFAAPSLNGSTVYRKNRYLRVDPTGTLPPEFGYSSELIGNGNVSPLPTFTGVSGYSTSTVTLNTTTTDPAVLELKTLKGQNPRIVLRYRYNVQTRTLKILTATYQPSTETVVLLEVTTVFTLDMSRFMGSWVGLDVPVATVADRLSIMGSTFPVAGVEMAEYQYMRSLVEAYSDTDFETSANHSVATVSPTLWAATVPDTVTEWLALPSDVGRGYVSHSGLLPRVYWKDRENVGIVLRSVTDRLQWARNWSEAGKISHLSSFIAVIPTGPYAIGSVDVTQACTYGSRVIAGGVGGEVVTFDPATTSAGVTKTLNLAPERQRVGVPIYLEFIPSSQLYTDFKVEFTVVVKDTSGTTRSVVTPNNITTLLSSGRIYLIQKRNPWHLTQAMWQYMQNTADGERLQDNTGFGRWS